MGAAWGSRSIPWAHSSMVDVLATDSDSTTRAADVHSWFDRASNWIVAGSLAMGALLDVQIFLDNAGRFDPETHGNLAARSGYALIAHGLAGLALAALVRALGIWVGAFANRSAPPPAAPFIAERKTEAEPAVAVEPAAKVEGEELEAARGLIEAGDWDEAEARVDDLLAAHPGDRRVERLAERLSRAKREAGERWFEQLRAAREVNDANRVLELYQRIPPAQAEEDRKTLDQDLASWFLSLVHHRLRGGGVQLEIVTLVERVSESFGHTAEGASLRASLPTLRRSVGLCPRCGRPYLGTADACPVCLAGKAAATTTPEPEFAEDVEPPTAGRDSEWFVDRDDDDSPA